MWPIVVTSIALLLVLEGILPFLSPQLWRKLMFHAVRRDDQRIRLMGLLSLLGGTGLMLLVHSGLF